MTLTNVRIIEHIPLLKQAEFAICNMNLYYISSRFEGARVTLGAILVCSLVVGKICLYNETNISEGASRRDCTKFEMLSETDDEKTPTLCVVNSYICCS